MYELKSFHFTRFLLQGNMSSEHLLRYIFKCTLFIFAFTISCTSEKEETRVLVFSKTAGYRHESIASGIKAIHQLAAQYNFITDTTEDASNFNEPNLKRYKAVIFLNTTGDVLNQEQQNDFERFIQAGGGFVGIHAAADTEYDWPWYGKLVGAYFESHPRDPNVRSGVFQVINKTHPSTDSLPDLWERHDEFYSFKQINPDINVLIKIDEKSYQGGTNGDNHPMAWYHEFDGGRAFYTNMGHTNETFSEPLYLRHLWGGIRYALGGEKPVELNYKKARTVRVPEENRFAKVVLDEKLEEPMELALLPDGNVLFIERRGKVKIYDQAQKKTEVIATIPVNTKYRSKDGRESEAEDGLLGVTLDPDFEKNHWIYLYYSEAGTEPRNILTRYELNGKALNEASKKVILEVIVQREQCCHTGGSMAWDEHGNLLLSTGDNTSPRATGYSPIDEREERYPWDAQKSSSNTNDLRGKIIRIHPEDDGTYTIPNGNLFPAGTPKTRPEIYGMGMRNPFRISYDKRTGFLYWGDVGPDASLDSVGRGPMGHDEVNQARKAGFFGWPYFVGNNKPYYERDFAANTYDGAPFDPARPVNNSPNNTGLTELPPAQEAFIWYPYDKSSLFPLVGSGGRTAMAGPVFYSEDFENAPRAFPDYYDGKLFIYEWMRGWIMAVTMDEEGGYVSMEQFMPSYKFSNPMDMEFSKDGDLYILEYGTGWFRGNEDARLVRIEYTEGNRKPIVKIAASSYKGATPFEVNLSSKGTIDYDHDELNYQWTIAQGNTTLATLRETNPSYTFDKPGVYNASLVVTDTEGNTSESSLEIQAGNEPPELTFEITRGNKMFFLPGQSFEYETTVSDKEDGALGNGISPEEVSVSITYMKEGFDKIEVVQGHLSADAIADMATGKKIMDQSDCKSCHTVDKKSIGPTYKQIAERYKDDAEAVEQLAGKIIHGGSGVWGDVAMAAHPQLSQEDATEIVNYILSLGNESTSLPSTGSYTNNIAKESANQGALLLRAAYTDKGANNVPRITSEKVLVLKSPVLLMNDVDETSGVRRFRLNNPPMELIQAVKHDGYILFKQIDMTGVDEMVITNMVSARRKAVGGVLEARLGAPDGALLGTSEKMKPQQSQVRFDPQTVRMKIKPMEGLQDIYFVFKNDKVKDDQSLFTLMNIQLISNRRPEKISMK